MFRGNNERYPNPTYHFSQSFIVLVMLCTRNSAKFSIHRCVSRFFSSIFIYISAILVTHIRQRTSHFIPFPRISFRIFPIPSFFSPDQRIEQIDFLDRWDLWDDNYTSLLLITCRARITIKTINIICERAC